MIWSLAVAVGGKALGRIIRSEVETKGIKD
jgi:hypothetical protein